MEMNELRYFLAVSETENVNKASEIIGISAGSLSKAIARLESELGVKLFKRVGRRIELTQEGYFLKEKASIIVNIETETKLEILGQEISFKAIIGGSETLLAYFGVSIADDILNLYPKSKIELTPCDRNILEKKISSGEINLGLTTEKPYTKNVSSFDIKKLAQVKFYTVVSSGHPLYKKAKKGDSFPIEEVLKYNFVVPKNNMLGKTTSEQSTDGWRDDKFPRKRPYITPSLKTLETFVKSGKAIAYLPDYLVNSENYQVLSITGCPYDCKQEVYLLTRNKKELGWINQVF